MLLLHNFDNKITAAIRSLPDTYKPLMTVLTIAGEPLVVVSLGVLGLLSASQHKQPAIEHAFAYGIIAFGLNTILKLLLHRTRPHGLIIRTLGLRSYSFPSGHAFGTVIFYGLFAYLDIKYLAHPWNTLIAICLALTVFLIGVSRVYLGAHYPSDVVAGWFLGVVSLAIINSLAF